MKKALTVLFTFLLLSSAWAEKPAAWLDSIDGAKNVYKHFSGDPEDKWYRAHLEMNGLVLDGFKTDKASLASLRFYLGSRVNLDKGSRIRIVSERDVVFLEKGSMWSFFRKGEEKEKKRAITIQTAGGVMAIKGTEFVVKVADKGEEQVTEVSVLEGTVEVTPHQSGSPTYVEPNTTVRFNRYGIVEILNRVEDEHKAYLQENFADLWSMRQLLQESREVADLIRYQKVRLTAEERKADDELRRVYWLTTGKDVGASGSGGTDTSNIDALFAELDAKMQGKTGTTEGDTGTQTDLSALLNGENAASKPTSQKFDWGWMEGTRFAFLILAPTDDEQVFWVEKTEAKSFVYPTDAKPLAPGSYRYRVVPLDEAGNPNGRPTEDIFSVAAP